LREGVAGKSAILEAMAALESAECTRVVVEVGARRQAASPAFGALVSRLQAGDSVVVPELDHLANTLTQLVERLADLAGRDIRFETLSGELDLGRPFGDILLPLHKFAERTRGGLNSSKRQSPGRPRQLLAPDVARAREQLELAGRTIQQVADEFGVSRATLYRSLREKP
jgi:DNA invertase Pin-like site-specific DNA recombinase